MKVAIVGWGVDTRDVVPYLLSRGDQITVFDRKTAIDKGNFTGLRWELGKENFSDLSGFDLIIRNPAVYRYRPEIVAAEKAGVEISSKTEIFFDLCPARIIGVTGTKGKGTTATLIYEILKEAGKDVYLGGNIGKGLFGFLPELSKNSWVVLELSSFQLIDLSRSAHIAVVLMVTSEHLDWHKNTAEYVGAKKNIVSHQKKSDFAVVNRDYPNSVAIGRCAGGKVIEVSGRDASGVLTRLRGEHNKENIASALAVAKIVGVDSEIALKVVANFSGLEHRLEEVATVSGVTFYNDSFSTTPETAIAAVRAFSEPEIVILGGSEKGSDFGELGRVIATSKNVKAVILIGLTGERIEKAIKEAGGARRFRVVRGGRKMEEIVKTAYNMAVPGDVVLLSPASASFDMFENYLDRGRQFKEQVGEILRRGSGFGRYEK